MKSIRTVKNSSLPTIIIKLINSLIGELNILKSLVGPSCPKAVPVLVNMAAVAVKVVVISRLSKESTKAVKKYISRESIVKEVTDDTVSAEITLLPSLTATTDLGCNLLRKPLKISLSRI